MSTCTGGAIPTASTPQPDQDLNSYYGTSLVAQEQQARTLRKLDAAWPATTEDNRMTHSTRVG